MIEKKIIKKGAVNHEVEITDVNYGTLVLFLEFLYTGYFDDICMPHDLVDLAVELDVPSLRDRCFQELERSMEVCNVLEILVLADKHQNYNLKASALKMITDHLAEIKKEQDIDEFEKKYPQLLKEIIVSSKII
ncbi:hypothetical protein QAD02_000132 [Eretmocerus hayati]|uniref:Uncharacterized protein n=1 Tax=Eretmocerus hayati TaxID=131215 RepID=A0ACC2NCN9_9HYME|nr:hypothetical protein QAD02_000132 [Eretmocerus hayati]